ncbi:phosphopentomutase [Parasphaerochaeta coccoides]|nr:phosphopentomutase [Parasphaerochaeta coccoides]
MIIVLDGFGVGQMPDVPQVRPQDIGSDTWGHILDALPEIKLPVLEQLGLMNITGRESENMKISPSAIYGKGTLTHHGADTFFGHQEIVGTKYRTPFSEPFKNKIDTVRSVLQEKGYRVREYAGEKEKILIVNDAVTVADNIECDPGQAFNVTGALDFISFEEELKIGRLVRSVSLVPRVITFGGRNTSLEKILSALEEHDNGYIGINAPESGVYDNDYHCVHMGYGVNPDVQAPSIIGRAGLPSILLGKAADVIQNPFGHSFSIVETEAVLDKMIEVIQTYPEGFICCNVQETDLSGHQESVEKYARILRLADRKIGEIIRLMDHGDILVVMADHGNDPTIGHPHHTREYVPLMIHCAGFHPGCIGIRKTLSDVGATATDYFKLSPTENGTSFLQQLQKF